MQTLLITLLTKQVLLAATLNVSNTKLKQSHTITNPTQSPYPLLPTYTEDQQQTNESGPKKPTLSTTHIFLNRA